MKEGLKTIAGIFGIITLVLVIGWYIGGANLLASKFYLPVQEQIRRKTFEQSKAYRQGAVQELQNMQFEYLKATPDQKPGLAYIIRHRAADLPRDAIPNDLYQFIQELP